MNHFIHALQNPILQTILALDFLLACWCLWQCFRLRKRRAQHEAARAESALRLLAARHALANRIARRSQIRGTHPRQFPHHETGAPRSGDHTPLHYRG